MPNMVIIPRLYAKGNLKIEQIQGRKDTAHTIEPRRKKRKKRQGRRANKWRRCRRSKFRAAMVFVKPIPQRCRPSNNSENDMCAI